MKKTIIVMPVANEGDTMADGLWIFGFMSF